MCSVLSVPVLVCWVLLEEAAKIQSLSAVCRSRSCAGLGSSRVSAVTSPPHAHLLCVEQTSIPGAVHCSQQPGDTCGKEWESYRQPEWSWLKWCSLSKYTAPALSVLLLVRRHRLKVQISRVWWYFGVKWWGTGKNTERSSRATE